MLSLTVRLSIKFAKSEMEVVKAARRVIADETEWNLTESVEMAMAPAE
jgi:hypothetical protein